MTEYYDQKDKHWFSDPQTSTYDVLKHVHANGERTVDMYLVQDGERELHASVHFLSVDIQDNTYTVRRRYPSGEIRTTVAVMEDLQHNKGLVSIKDID